MKKFIIIIINILFIIVPAVHSEEQKPVTSKKTYLQQTIEEKMKISLEDVLNYLKNNKISKSSELKKNNIEEIQSMGNEVVVSADALPESEIHAAINPTDTNNIVISPMNFNSSSMLEGLLCPIYYTSDFGKKWQKSTFKTLPTKANTVVLGGGDPMFAFDSDGKLYMSWINLYAHLVGFSADSLFATTFWSSSTDGGKNWNRQTNDIIGSSGNTISNSLNSMHDKEWSVIDKSTSQYHNNLYTSLTFLDGIRTNNTKANIVVYKKPANSQTYLKDSVIVSKGQYDFVQFSSIDVDKSGNVHVTFFGTLNGNNAIYHSISTDGGVTFKVETKISDFILYGSQMIPSENQQDSIVGLTSSRFYICPQFAIDKEKTGNLYMTWTADGINQKGNNGKDIYFCFSKDNGQSWSTPVIINDDTKGIKRSQYYSSISVNQDGVIVISWYDRRDDANDIMTHYYVAYSFDEGKTFTKNIPVTSVATNFSTIGLMNGGFGIGEYNQLLTTRGYAIPVWADGRTNNGNTNVYAAFVPITKDPTSVESITPINSNFILSEPTPNPSTSEFNIRFELGKSSEIKLQLIDNQGFVKDLANGKYEPNTYNIEVVTNMLSPGSYFIRLITGYGYAVRKLIIIK